MSAKEFVQKELDSGKTVTLFIWETCPHCASARSLFQSIYGDEYEANVNVVSVEGREDVRDELKSITGARSVPRIFINKESIGGNDAAQELNRSGKLRVLLGVQ